MERQKKGRRCEKKWKYIFILVCSPQAQLMWLIGQAMLGCALCLQAMLTYPCCGKEPANRHQIYTHLAAGSKEKKKKARMKWEPDHMLSIMKATAQRENYTNEHNTESRGSVVGKQKPCHVQTEPKWFHLVIFGSMSQIWYLTEKLVSIKRGWVQLTLDAFLQQWLLSLD